MLTIFCTAKHFVGHSDVIQRNAIRSWCLLDPKPEILLLGDGEGYPTIVKELGLRHVPDVDCNEYGTPLVSSMFSKAQAIASNRLLCYLDADIILMDDFMPAVRAVAEGKRDFMLAGPSVVASVEEALDFEQGRWQETLKNDAERYGRTHGSAWGIDYFVFPRGAVPGFPPFAVGRPGWDNWLIYFIRSLGLPLIDGRRAVTAIHQDHDYSFHPEGSAGIWKGPEAVANKRLAGNGRYSFSLADSTHVLTKQGLRRAMGVAYLWRRIYTTPILHPCLAFVRPVLDALLWTSKPLRKRMGLTIKSYFDR